MTQYGSLCTRLTVRGAQVTVGCCREASQMTFRWLHCWCAVVDFLGRLIRQWATLMSCRSTSKAMWQRLIEMTRRDTPGACSTETRNHAHCWLVKNEPFSSVRPHPVRSLCHATRASRCQRTSSGWRKWCQRSLHPGHLTTWRSSLLSGLAALDE